MKPTLITLFIATAFLTLWWGEVPWPLVLKGALDRLWGLSNDWNPLLDERIPRFLVLLATGASLAVSGAVMQSLFQNPLASPGILGISCGGSLLVVLVFIFGWHLLYPYAIPIAAVLGCLAVLLLVYLLSHYSEGTLTSLILIGVALSTLLIAIQGAIFYAIRDQWALTQTLIEWEAGSTLDRSWQHVHMQMPLTLVGLYGCWHYRQEMDILALGEEEAASLGVDVKRVRWRLFLCVALLTGGTIAAVGIIAFFGLVLPHLMRKLVGVSHLKLIPSCTFGGALSFALMDLFLRMLQIQIFSIGNISAILGGFFFLVLFFESRRQWKAV